MDASTRLNRLFFFTLVTVSFAFAQGLFVEESFAGFKKLQFPSGTSDGAEEATLLVESMLRETANGPEIGTAACDAADGGDPFCEELIAYLKGKLAKGEPLATTKLTSHPASKVIFISELDRDAKARTEALKAILKGNPDTDCLFVQWPSDSQATIEQYLAGTGGVTYKDTYAPMDFNLPKEQFDKLSKEQQSHIQAYKDYLAGFEGAFQAAKDSKIKVIPVNKSIEDLRATPMADLTPEQILQVQIGDGNKSMADKIKAVFEEGKCKKAVMLSGVDPVVIATKDKKVATLPSLLKTSEIPSVKIYVSRTTSKGSPLNEVEYVGGLRKCPAEMVRAALGSSAEVDKLLKESFVFESGGDLGPEFLKLVADAPDTPKGVVPVFFSDYDQYVLIKDEPKPVVVPPKDDSKKQTMNGAGNTPGGPGTQVGPGGQQNTQPGQKKGWRQKP